MRVLANLFVGVSMLTAVGSASADADTGGGIDFFERRIRPILVARCYSCHSVAEQKAKGGLLLDSREGILKGGESGPAIVPGDPRASLLLKAIGYDDGDIEMPPKQTEQLAPQQVADFEAWIRMGAPDPRDGALVKVQEKPTIDWDTAKGFWSYQPLAASAVPAVKDAAWARTDIDRFILAKLEEAALKPAPDADRATLLRRATFDLIGLPPTPQEIRAFVNDRSPQAFAKVVDRLLGSRHYGERWGRHWLDVVRYSDSSGDQADFPLPHAWRYRNYVVDAFNKDKPYNVFVQDQIAGDLMPHRNEKERQEQIVATGFIAISRYFLAEAEKFRHLTIDDTIDTVGRSFLGLTLGCARCHDHKFDPLPTKDYYSLYGIFDSTRYPWPGSETQTRPKDMRPLVSPAKMKTVVGAYQAHQKRLQELDDEMKALKKTKPPESEITKQRTVIDAHEASAPPVPWAYAVSEFEDPAQVGNRHIMVGGDPKAPGEQAPRGFLTILGGQKLSEQDVGSGRKQLAAWLTDPANPLTARVMVNRIWLNHFGQGLVRTPNDFGTRGAPPTHPELFDHLAARFMKHGWSIKALHRDIMLSRVYQMAVIDDESAETKDSGNTLMWTFNRKRLDAESMRDAMLSVTGELDRSPGGAHPMPPLPWKFSAARLFKADWGEDKRRSVYQVTQRGRRSEFFELFDGADANLSVPQRSDTTTPLQALYFMNSPFAAERSLRFAERVFEAHADDRERVRLAFTLAFGREPNPNEYSLAAEYLGRFQHARVGWESFSKALLGSNEFAYLD